jgi:DNA-directed RNA polymerase specialized sigma54-like protein
MPEEEIKNDYLDSVNKKPENENQVDNFSQTTKLLDKELSDKKENILKVLEE